MKQSMVEHKKGEVVQTFNIWKAVPLYKEDPIDFLQRVAALPEFDAEIGFRPSRVPLPPPVEALARRLIARQSFQCEAVVSCLHLVALGDHIDFLDQCSGDDQKHHHHDEVEEGGRSYEDLQKEIDCPVSLGLRDRKVIEESIDWNTWLRLLKAVSARLLVVECPHPLSRYATYKLPNLSGEDRSRAFKILLSILNDGVDRNQLISPSRAILSIMKRCQDRYGSPRRIGVLLHRHDDVHLMFEHSCIPSAWIELYNENNDSQVQVRALYDMRQDDSMTLCYVGCDDDVEVREANVVLRTGRACACIRCRYEINPLIVLSKRQRLELARYYMSKGQTETAQVLLEDSLSDEPDQPDVWHALGAIKLSNGHFLAAQRLWNEGIDRFPESCRTHVGMALQSKKIQCYQYFKPVTNPLVRLPCSSNCLFPNAHIAQMLTRSTCRQILEWGASSGEWTKHRHYAVPTNDVPVHTVEPLLNWFSRWFNEEMRPLMARQFVSSTNFFVHDAFCVRYDATEMSNHLPVHTDESTHSFVIALNDCDEYSGGGTYFPQNDSVVRLKVGEVLSFRGDSIRHGGEAVTKNVRHILVAFLYHDDDGVNGKKDEAGRERKRMRYHGPGNPRSEAAETQSEFSFGFDL